MKSSVTKKPLSKTKREVKRLKPFVITSRDYEIMLALSRYRLLTVSQVKQLFFRSNKDNQGANRRLKHLFHAGYVGKVSSYRKIEEGTPEYTYYLDRKGRKYLEEAGHIASMWPNPKSLRHSFLQHAIDLSQFRVHLENGLKEQSIVSLKKFIPDFQMKRNARSFASRERYELYTEVIHPKNRRSYVIYPDALITLEVESSISVGVREALYFLEIDRGTHGLEKVREKVLGYELYHQKGIHRSLGSFSDFTVLFQTSSQKRAQNILRAIEGTYGAERVWVTSYPEVDSDTLLFEPIWSNVDGDKKVILLKRSEQELENYSPNTE